MVEHPAPSINQSISSCTFFLTRGIRHKDQSPDDIRMAGAISARWMGSVEGQAVVWKTAQTECTSYAMGLQDRDREESVATEVCVRAVDARHGGQADPG